MSRGYSEVYIAGNARMKKPPERRKIKDYSVQRSSKRYYNRLNFKNGWLQSPKEIQPQLPSPISGRFDWDTVWEQTNSSQDLKNEGIQLEETLLQLNNNTVLNKVEEVDPTQLRQEIAEEVNRLGLEGTHDYKIETEDGNQPLSKPKKKKRWYQRINWSLGFLPRNLD